MPQSNEHAARQRDPDDFVRIAQLWPKEEDKEPNYPYNKDWARGIGGPLKSDPKGATVVQAVRFNARHVSIAEAKAWLKKHGYKTEVEAAKGEKQNATAYEERSIPGAALRFFGESELGENGEGAKSAPLKMLARSSKPIHHWFWGNVAHDMSGMRLHKSRIAVDYCHDSKDIIGYVNKFAVDAEKGLELSGALTPYKDNDRATEIIHKSRLGVPYEASIFFEPEEIEELEDGDVADVNGYELSGPGVIFRTWGLRGVAVCPHGADKNTISQFSQNENDKVIVKITRKGNVMGDQKIVDAAGAEIDRKEDELITTPLEGQPVDAGKTEKGASAPVESTLSASQASQAGQIEAHAEFARMVQEFGSEFAAECFAKGFSFADAKELYFAKLKEENEKLREQNVESAKKLSSVAKLGEEKPLAPSVATDDPFRAEQRSRAQKIVTGGVSPALAAYAAKWEIKNKEREKQCRD